MYLTRMQLFSINLILAYYNNLTLSKTYMKYIYNMITTKNNVLHSYRYHFVRNYLFKTYIGNNMMTIIILIKIYLCYNNIITWKSLFSVAHERVPPTYDLPYYYKYQNVYAYVNRFDFKLLL